jgi:DNA polymerase-3 subunit epsilon
MNKPFVNLCLSRPLAVLDVETTGIAPRSHRVVEIAVLKYRPDTSVRQFHCLLNPGFSIPAAATAIHAITDADVAGKPTFEIVAARLSRFLRDCDLCGFNIKRFDLPFLLAEFRRAGMRFSVARRAIIDVLQIYHQRERRDLGAAARHYLGCKPAKHHHALVDAQTTAAILDNQLAFYPDLARQVPELHTSLAEVDVAGRLRLQDGEVVFAFGKHNREALREVAQNDPEYLRWLLTQDFLPDFLAFVRQAIKEA